MTRRALVGTLLLVAAGSGCNAPAPTARTYSYLRLPDTPQSAAFDAALAAMRERYRIDAYDREEGVITSLPEESREVLEQRRVGDMVGVPRRVRRIATTQVTGSDASAEVWCKVLIQRYEAQAAQLFRNDLQMEDAPTGTAADRGSATTQEQNEVWRTARRDKSAERSLLRAVEERAAPPAK